MYVGIFISTHYSPLYCRLINNSNIVFYSVGILQNPVSLPLWSLQNISRSSFLLILTGLHYIVSRYRHYTVMYLRGVIINMNFPLSTDSATRLPSQGVGARMGPAPAARSARHRPAAPWRCTAGPASNSTDNTPTPTSSSPPYSSYLVSWQHRQYTSDDWKCKSLKTKTSGCWVQSRLNTEFNKYP